MAVSGVRRSWPTADRRWRWLSRVRVTRAAMVLKAAAALRTSAGPCSATWGGPEPRVISAAALVSSDSGPHHPPRHQGGAQAGHHDGDHGGDHDLDWPSRAGADKHTAHRAVGIDGNDGLDYVRVVAGIAGARWTQFLGNIGDRLMQMDDHGMLARMVIREGVSEALGERHLLGRHGLGIVPLVCLAETPDRTPGARSGGDAAGNQAPEIRIGFENGAEQTERPLFHHRRLDVVEDEIEQRLHAVVVRAFEAGRHPALLGGAVEDREIELLVAGVERGEQVEHLVDHLNGPRVGAVDLVDHHDGLEPHLERLRHHEFGLRQRAFGGVHQHQRAVHHVEDALDLAAEIGVAGRVDDIDAGVLPDHRGGLGQDGDAALALEIVGIHGALGHALVLAERAGLLQQPVDQRGLAVVDVGDDGDVAEIHGP